MRPKIDPRQAMIIRHLAGIEEGGEIPAELIDRIHSIQERMRGLGKTHLDVQHLAIMVEFQYRPTNPGGQIGAGTTVLVEEDGMLLEGTLIRYPAGKDTGKVHVRMREQEAGKYRVFSESVVRAADEVMA